MKSLAGTLNSTDENEKQTIYFLSHQRSQYMCQTQYMFYIRFFVGFRLTEGFFTHVSDVTITGEGLQILTFTRHVCPSSSEGSLACHIYCETGHPFIMVISEPWHSHLLPSIWQLSCPYLFLNLSLSRLGFDHTTFRMRGYSSNQMFHHGGSKWVWSKDDQGKGYQN